MVISAFRVRVFPRGRDDPWRGAPRTDGVKTNSVKTNSVKTYTVLRQKALRRKTGLRQEDVTTKTASRQTLLISAFWVRVFPRGRDDLRGNTKDRQR